MANPSSRPQRVVSLLGASTETLYRIGLGHLLVGRSHECDYPPAVLSLPCVSRPRLDVDAPSADIDASVRSHSAAGEPVYKLDDRIISTLDPDLIIAQDHCRVCAITPDDVDGSEVCLGVKQLIVRPSTLQECLSDIVSVADAVGYAERGLALKETLEGRLDRIRDLVAPLTAESKHPRVALCEWCDPIMGCGYWLPELVSVAGGRALHCPPPGGATPTISFQALLDSQPDVVIFALCGFGLTRAATEIRQAWGEDMIQQLMETCEGRLYIVDGNYLVNRSGPRVVESAEAICEATHLELQGHFGHFGTDYLSTLNDALKMAEIGLHTGSAKLRPQPFKERDDGKPKNVATSKVQSVRVTGSPASTVANQLTLLTSGDIYHAFALNSTANKGRWCAPERFEAVLKSHSDFSRLLNKDDGAYACTAEVSDDGRIAVVPVIIPARDNLPKVELVWTMVAEEKEKSAGGVVFDWRTEKVGPK